MAAGEAALPEAAATAATHTPSSMGLALAHPSPWAVQLPADANRKSDELCHAPTQELQAVAADKAALQEAAAAAATAHEAAIGRLRAELAAQRVRT